MNLLTGNGLRARLLRSIATLALMIPMFAAFAGSAPISAQSPLTQTLQSALAARMQELHIPGAAILVQDPKIGMWTTAIGTSDLKTQAPITTDMHFRVGSVTKTFTGTVILQLVDESKLRLDDPVAKYRPEVPNGANITLRQLLQMTSGLYNYTDDFAWNRDLDANKLMGWTPKELVAIGLAHPPYFAPGTNYHYSNTNTVLLGMIIEQVTGSNVEDEFARRIFKPLGMDNTTMPKSGTPAIPNPHPHGYFYGTLVAGLADPGLTDEVPAEAGPPVDWTDMNPSWAWTAGSAISTTHDLQIWAKALATGTLVSAAMQRERLTYVPSSPSPAAPGYGLGVANIGGYIGHTGALPGFQIFMGYAPATGSTIVVLTNLQNSPDGHETANALTMIIVQSLQAPTSQPTQPTSTAPASQSALPFFVRRLGDG